MITTQAAGVLPIYFDKTLATAGTPEDLFIVPAGRVVFAINLFVLDKDARFAYDAVASPTSHLVRKDGSYAVTDLRLHKRVSFLGIGGKPHVFGVAWAF